MSKPRHGQPQIEFTIEQTKALSQYFDHTTVDTDLAAAATADDHPAGTGLSELAAMVHGKSLQAAWTTKVTALPAGVAAHDIDELFLLLRMRHVTLACTDFLPLDRRGRADAAVRFE